MNPTDFYCRVVDYIIENEEYVPSAAEEQGIVLKESGARLGICSGGFLKKNFYYFVDISGEKKVFIIKGVIKMDVKF